jgi:hypothetical protein
MSQHARYERLTAIFRALGAPEPESWARSETDEGIPQLLRFLFLRGAWKRVLAADNEAWIASEIARAKSAPDAPLSGVGQALERLVDGGADPRDLSMLVRGMQYTTLFGIAYLLDDPGPAFDDLAVVPAEVEAVGWGLWEESADGAPIRRIGSLHESALETDPTGQEMRPTFVGGSSGSS